MGHVKYCGRASNRAARLTFRGSLTNLFIVQCTSRARRDWRALCFVGVKGSNGMKHGKTFAIGKQITFARRGKLSGRCLEVDMTICVCVVDT